MPPFCRTAALSTLRWALAAHFGLKLRLAYRSTLSPAELGAPARAHRQELKMPQAFSTPELHSQEPMLADMWANVIRLVRVALLRFASLSGQSSSQEPFSLSAKGPARYGI